MEARTVVLTGVGPGIGRALSLRMAQKGWHVIGTARDAAAAGSHEWPAGVEIAELDLSRPESVEALIGDLSNRPVPDLRVNNAGALLFGAIEECSQADTMALFQVNLLGAMRLTQALVPRFRERSMPWRRSRRPCGMS